jgi:hypothetical protein
LQESDKQHFTVWHLKIKAACLPISPPAKTPEYLTLFYLLLTFAAVDPTGKLLVLPRVF